MGSWEILDRVRAVSLSPPLVCGFVVLQTDKTTLLTLKGVIYHHHCGTDIKTLFDTQWPHSEVDAKVLQELLCRQGRHINKVQDVCKPHLCKNRPIQPPPLHILSDYMKPLNVCFLLIHSILMGIHPTLPCQVSTPL